jgi:hypothetical protein
MRSWLVPLRAVAGVAKDDRSGPASFEIAGLDPDI